MNGPHEHDAVSPNARGTVLTLSICCLLVAFGSVFLLVDYLQPFADVWHNPISMETLTFAQTGKNLARGRGFTTEWILPAALKYTRSLARVPDLYNPPLYPALLGIFFAVFGVHFHSILLCTGVLFLATGVCIFLFARNAFGPYAAMAAAALFLSNPGMRMDAIAGLNRGLIALLITVLFWRIYKSRMSSPRDNLLIGALAGLCYLAEYSYWVLMLPLCASCLVSTGEQRFRNLLALLGGFCAASVCWWIRNALIAGNPFFTLRLGAGLYGKAFTSTIEPALTSIGDMLALGARVANLKWQSGALVMMYGNWLGALFIAAAFWRCDDARMQWTRKVLYITWVTIWIFVGSRTIGINALMALPFLPLVCIIVSGFIFRIATAMDLRRVSMCIALGVTLVAFNVGVLPNWYYTGGWRYEYFDHAPLNKVPRERMLFSDRALPVAWVKDRPVIEIPMKPEDCAKIASTIPGGVAMYISPDFGGEYGAFSAFWGEIHAAATDGVLSRALPMRHGESFESFADFEYLFY
ncbi:MAG: glycosyltransferase family 39 protein [Candidatus Aureabacteria bacterium]|nr:glycosyltransferase family 39 protein [Candidatus Auribacterota bacterium]